jgi:ribonuclease P protein component
MFRPHEHITRRVDFEAAYGAGAKVNGRLMTVFVRPNGGQHARLGIAATRKIGGAVTRNRAKRLTRELFRTHKPMAPLDIVVVPRREFLDAPYATLEREFDALVERAARFGRRGAASRPQQRRPRGARADSSV